MLPVPREIRLGDRVRAQHAVLATRRRARIAAGALDAAVDDEVRDMDVLRTELAREALREAAQRELAHGEGRRLGVALHAGGGAGKEKRAATTLDHAFERRLRDEEAPIGADDQCLEYF